MRLLATALLACGLAPPAPAAVKDQAANGFTLENSQWVPVKPDAAWNGLLAMGHWWPKDHTWWGDASRLSLEPRAGGCFCEIDGARQARHMTVVFAEPGKLLRLAGGLGPLQGMGLSGAMEWRLAEENGGTRITLWYRAGGYTPDDLRTLAPVVDRVQGQQLGGLVEYLRQGK
ncbi:SRPBCC family protein [Pseudoxanthomonas sp.]|uniref:SRPBCC family protein n=1 Tax=Pseudoxanthomonas sp. TaxID=1871049 RepID=UPI003F7D139C